MSKRARSLRNMFLNGVTNAATIGVLLGVFMVDTHPIRTVLMWLLSFGWIGAFIYQNY